jgi:hypothetical protein
LKVQKHKLKPRLLSEWPEGRAAALKASFTLQIFQPGLPDGIFAYQKYQFWYILEGLGMENVGVVISIWYIYDHLVNCTTVWYIL